MKGHTVDVLMAAHNEAATIAKSLQSIAAQQVDEKYHFRVHVITNGCTDDTSVIAQQTIAELPPRSNMQFQVHTRPVANKIKALNFGLEQGHAPVVFSVDADSFFSPRCFAETLALFDDPEVMVGGALSELIVSRKNCNLLLGRIQRTANVCTRLYEATTPSGCMLGFRRDLIAAYPTTIAAEDTWIAFQAIKRFGWQAVKVTRNATVRVVAPQHWLDYLKQESRFSRGTAQMLETFPDLRSVREEQIKMLKKKSREYHEALRQALKKQHLSMTYVKYRHLFAQMCEENATMLANQLVSSDGQWEPIFTTKQVVNEEC